MAGKKNPIDKALYISKEYKKYLRSSFSFGSDKLQALFEERLNEEQLYKGPYVNLSLPFKRGLSIQELINEGTVCKKFAELGDVNLTRPLYFHQEKAIRLIKSGHSAVVTTGTGSGKTECFLYPILNDLLFDLEAGNHEVGIRAIFLYPMNALVNDQVERIRKMLCKCPDITYGFFTGDTKESMSAREREHYASENNVVIPDNELLTRDEIRKNPPHLLFTNYSMLEYLLIRPNDYALFTETRLNNWKYVVLDEAHSYSGALGIELSLLMRRLTGMATKKPRFILTSATLGKEGKSEGEIVDFARNLTSAYFDVEDIIFSKRIPLDNDKCKYTISGDDYIELKRNISDNNFINTIISKYKRVETNKPEDGLYDLLSGDNNTYRLYKLLSSESLEFDSLISELGLSKEQLSALIDLINTAEKNGISLFDLKYHSFIRPLSGAYLTLSDNPQLSLKKANVIDGFRAFEVGNCRYCGSPYIFGREVISSENNIKYLYQNNEIDIYENYGDNISVKLEYYLLENSINEDEIESDVLEPQKLCVMCGSISDGENLNAHTCECGDKYKKIIYKVKQKKEDDEGVTIELAYNNINQCPCCGHKGKAGVVKSFNLGKDEGTAIVGDFLFEAIDEGGDGSGKKNKISLLKKNTDTNSDNGSKVKQYLTFSDSRQQASFSAVFMNSTHVHMLRKRLIWKAIEDKNYNAIGVEELAADLTKLIKQYNLFDNDMSDHKNAWLSVLIDLLKVDGSYDGEGLGLYHYELDIDELMSAVDDDEVEELFGKYNISKADLATAMQVVFEVFKTTPAINYTKSTLTPDEKMDELEFRRFDNYVVFNGASSESGVRSFMPIKAKENRIVRYVEKAFGCNADEAKEIMGILFDLAVEGELLEKHAIKDIYQINAGKYVLKNYRTSKYYVCSKCGKMTPFNVHNACPFDKCTGKLSLADPDAVLAKNYYRWKYMNKNIEKITIKEHTAQLDRKQAKQYQNDFKNKKINILSCSTTFEMGIDIGNLETVFMRNVPPSPANYVQRAGRAGRRKDSSAFILTYCGTGSHDYTYYSQPEKMISGEIRPPYFNVVNDKIIIRHLIAAGLGFFFRKYPDYFKNIGSFIFNDGVDKFREYIGSHPVDLNDYINEKVLPEDRYKKYRNFEWFDEADGNDEKMQLFVDDIKSMANEYSKAIEYAVAEERYNEANYYKVQLDHIYKEKVIDSLSKYSVIPKYGFPVDVVDLQIYNDGKYDDRYDLSRDLKIAISEYAPDSEVIVDGSKYTSKYISLPKKGAFTKYYYYQCNKCNRINRVLTKEGDNNCIFCKEPLDNSSYRNYIEPIYGFKTGKTVESTHIKPKRSYAGEVVYIGEGTSENNPTFVGSKIVIDTSTNDKFLVVNKSDFYMCPYCGYSDKGGKNGSQPFVIKEHNNFRQFKCECQELKKVNLGHTFFTDIARITITSLTAETKEDYDRALSFMYAFLEGISNALGIERNDIDGVLALNAEGRSWDVIIYDDVPGGAGHVKRILERGAIAKSLSSALEKVSQSCCDEETSCYNCLRNYRNQLHHNRLKRLYAKEAINELLLDLNS